MKTQRTILALTAINMLLALFLLARIRTASADDVAPVLRGSALEIVDARGQVRAKISVEPSVTMPDGKTYPEEVLLRLTDPSGAIRVKLGANQDGSGLLLSDSSRQPGVHILARGTGSFVRVANRDGREQTVKP